LVFQLIYDSNGLPLEWHFQEDTTMIEFMKYIAYKGVDIPENVTIHYTPK